MATKTCTKICIGRDNHMIICYKIEPAYSVTPQCNSVTENSSVDANGTGLNAHSAEADSMRIQFYTVWTVSVRLIHTDTYIIDNIIHSCYI